jgi:hypothetical protein
MIELFPIGDWFATQFSMAWPSLFNGSLIARLRNSLKLKRAADPEAGRDMHNQVLFGKSVLNITAGCRMPQQAISS